MATEKNEQLSPDICGSKLILFLGAGASASVDLDLMNSFMDRLEKNIPAELRSVLQHMYEAPDGSKDLEIVFDRIEKYHDLANYLQSDKNWTPRFNRQEIIGLIEQVGQIRKDAGDLVIRHYAAVDPEPVVSLYYDFLLLLLESNTPHHLPIFTTNYDGVIEGFADAKSEEFGLVDGFTTGSWREWSPDTTFHEYVAEGAPKRTLILFKLHGSSTWRLHKETNRVTKECISEPVSGDSPYENALVWPARTKQIKKGPYETNYRYLRECLNQAELCVVIGFSFRDEVIRGYFRRSVAANPALRLAIVDPRAEAIIENPLRLKGNTRVTAITSKFGKEELTAITLQLSKINFPWRPGHLIGLTAQPD